MTWVFRPSVGPDRTSVLMLLFVSVTSGSPPPRRVSRSVLHSRQAETTRLLLSSLHGHVPVVVNPPVGVGDGSRT